MTTVVVPFRSGGKTRLPTGLRAELSLAMLRDVLEAADSVGRVRLVTDDSAATHIANALGVEVVSDPGGGQGAAVASALASLDGRSLVVNADLPCVSRRALLELALRCPALVAAADGTTNALSLPAPGAFAPLYRGGKRCSLRRSRVPPRLDP